MRTPVTLHSYGTEIRKSGIGLLWKLRGYFVLRRAIKQGGMLSEQFVNMQGVISERRLKQWLSREGYIRDRELYVWYKPEKDHE